MRAKQISRWTLVVTTVAVLVASCSTAPVQHSAGVPAPSQHPASLPTTAPSTVPPSSSKYYSDDGPPANPPDTLDALPDAVPRAEPLHRFANRPYVVLGRQYVPATALGPYREQGIASWYGRKFHGLRTSIGEVYDMYAMTAAHPTLPLPSYARVTNVSNGRSVIVRVNDRGPFLHGRVIDLSYAAAHRLGIAQRGSGEVVVEALLPGTATFASATPVPSQPPGPGETVISPLGAPATVVAVPVPPVSGTPGQAQAPVVDATGGYVVQLGAFASEPNARSFLAHVQGQLASAQVEPRVRQSDGLYRVYIGPYPSRDDARRVADRLEAAFGVATAIAPR